MIFSCRRLLPNFAAVAVAAIALAGASPPSPAAAPKDAKAAPAAGQNKASANQPDGSNPRHVTIIRLKRDLSEGVPSPPPADPARVAAARPLVAALGLREKALASIERFVPTMSPAVKRQTPKMTDAEAKKVPDMLRANGRADLPNLLEYQAHVLARHYTVDELKALTAFYLTPAGKKLLAEQTKVEMDMAPAKRGFSYGYLVHTLKQVGGVPPEKGAIVGVEKGPRQGPKVTPR